MSALLPKFVAENVIYIGIIVSLMILLFGNNIVGRNWESIKGFFVSLIKNKYFRYFFIACIALACLPYLFTFICKVCPTCYEQCPRTTPQDSIKIDTSSLVLDSLDVKPIPKPQPKSAPKPKTKPAPKPQPKSVPKPQPKSVPKPQPKPAISSPLSPNQRWWINLSDDWKKVFEESANIKVGRGIPSPEQFDKIFNRRQFDLEGKKITDLKPLLNGQFTSLENIFGTKSLRSIQGIERLSTLYHLDISNTRITDIKPLYKLRKINILVVANTKIPPYQFKELKKTNSNVKIYFN